MAEVIQAGESSTYIVGGDRIYVARSGLAGPPGDVQGWLNALPQYANDEEAAADGLPLGDYYIVSAASDVLPAGTVKKRIA